MSEKTILDLNDNSQSADSGAPTIEDVIARGAASALEAEPGPATAPESGLEITEPRRRRKYTRRSKKEPSPEELQAQQAAEELAAFFSPEGIGAVFTSGMDACYAALGAPPLTDAERPMLARVFAQWATYRLPASASAYQPDILLVATVGMATLTRIKPIAETTAPWWRRMWDKVRRRPKVPRV